MTLLIKSLINNSRSEYAGIANSSAGPAQAALPHEEDEGNFTHRVGIGFCTVSDPLLQLRLNVAALFGDLLRHDGG